jgi:hypothetical protein
MEGVFHQSELLVDGVRVASHSDGWTPIEVDLTDALAGKRGFELGVDANTPDDRESGRLIANRDNALIDPERSLPLDDRNNFPQMLLRRRDGSPGDGRWMGLSPGGGWTVRGQGCRMVRCSMSTGRGSCRPMY